MLKLMRVFSFFLGLGFALSLYVGAVVGRFIRIFVKWYLDYKYGQSVEFANSRDAIYMIEKKKNLFEIVGLNVVEDRVNLPTFRHEIEKKWLRAQNLDGRWSHLKLRQCLHSELGYFFWTVKPDFCVDDHLSIHDSCPKTNEELHRILGEISTKPLPRDRPLWSYSLIYLAENFPGLIPGRHTCIIHKYHHGVCDGMSTVTMFNALLDEQREEFKPPARVQRNVSLTNRIYMMLDIFVRGVAMLVEDLIITRDHNIFVKPPLTGIKLVGISESIPLSRLKRIKNATGTTINDVLTSCIAGALRTFLIDRNADIPEHLRFYIPVSLHGSKAPTIFINYTSAIFHNFAVQETTALRRLMLTKRRMDEAKTSPQALAMYYTMISCCSSIPNFITSLFLKIPRVSGGFSNVPGPRWPVFFKEKEFLASSFFLAIGVNVGFMIGAFTQKDVAQFTLRVDTGLIKTQDEVYVILNNITKEVENLENEMAQSQQLKLASGK